MKLSLNPREHGTVLLRIHTSEVLGPLLTL